MTEPESHISTAGNQRRPRHSGPFRKIITGISLFFAICLIAVIGYVAAGWKLEDSIYMVIITIFGVGYGEVQPVESSALRALTIMVIIAGYGAVIYTIGGFMQMLIDGEINRALGARKMAKEIERMQGHTIICGIGRMGSILARNLFAAGKPFVVIDCDERRLKAAEEQGYWVIYGDASEETILEQAGIDRAAVLATVLSEDATNVFVTITAREMNAELLIIARGENPKTEKKLLGCGANRVVLPTAIGASKVAQLIMRPTAENMLEELTSEGAIKDELGHFGLQFEELQVTAGSAFVNKTLEKIEVRSERGYLVVAIRRANGDVEKDLTPDTTLLEGDTVIVLVHDTDVPRMTEKFASKGIKIRYRGATAEI
ncbi:potassium channel protein [Gimesia chilikensis]|uniref:potassium channel family protein n=1 Tax=Gimesia chilikensis TaxID=2605989 RepID=UPI0011EC2739|nr:potassium channel protein [Gimesia chilikensis]KAA0135416.1 potassium channel protein [Gimesia chilikensis]